MQPGRRIRRLIAVFGAIVLAVNLVSVQHADGHATPDGSPADFCTTGNAPHAPAAPDSGHAHAQCVLCASTCGDLPLEPAGPAAPAAAVAAATAAVARDACMPAQGQSSPPEARAPPVPPLS